MSNIFLTTAASVYADKESKELFKKVMKDTEITEKGILVEMELAITWAFMAGANMYRKDEIAYEDKLRKEWGMCSFDGPETIEEQP